VHCLLARNLGCLLQQGKWAPDAVFLEKFCTTLQVKHIWLFTGTGTITLPENLLTDWRVPLILVSALAMAGAVVLWNMRAMLLLMVTLASAYAGGKVNAKISRIDQEITAAILSWSSC
jgi:hypothetical protein